MLSSVDEPRQRKGVAISVKLPQDSGFDSVELVCFPTAVWNISSGPKKCNVRSTKDLNMFCCFLPSDHINGI